MLSYIHDIRTNHGNADNIGLIYASISRLITSPAFSGLFNQMSGQVFITTIYADASGPLPQFKSSFGTHAQAIASRDPAQNLSLQFDAQDVEPNYVLAISPADMGGVSAEKIGGGTGTLSLDRTIFHELAHSIFLPDGINPDFSEKLCVFLENNVYARSQLAQDNGDTFIRFGHGDGSWVAGSSGASAFTGVIPQLISHTADKVIFSGQVNGLTIQKTFYADGAGIGGNTYNNYIDLSATATSGSLISFGVSGIIQKSGLPACSPKNETSCGPSIPWSDGPPPMTLSLI